MTNEPDPGKLSAEDFQPLVDQMFSATVGDQVLSLKLEECKAQPHYQAEGFRMPFSLIFTSPEQVTVSQGTYETDCPGLGTVSLFFVPVATGKYEVLFN